jgi:hypothetical protein
MPVTEKGVIRQIQLLCRKCEKNKLCLEVKKTNPQVPMPLTSYQKLKANPRFNDLVRYLQVEINHSPARFQDMYTVTPKHQVVRILGTILGHPSGYFLDAHERETVEAIADYLITSKNKEAVRPRKSGRKKKNP